VYNAVVLNLAPSGPLYGSQPDSPAFFSPAWWRILRGVLDGAKKRGLRIWLYDQLGFSTARIQERLMERDASWRAPDLRVVEQLMTGPAQIRLTAPGRAVAACAVALTGDGLPTGAVAHISSAVSGGYLNKAMPPGRWRVMLFYETPGGFDYMSPVAAGKLLGFVHGEFERKLKPHLGTTIPGTFQDELPAMNRWTRGFLDEFRRRKGYDLRPWLPHLWYSIGPRTAKIRCDVADVQAALLERAFFRPLYDWHQRHGMICSYDQMVRDGDPIEANRYYVDYARTMRWYQSPGNDQTGLTKPHSSLAHLYRRPRVWLEGFYNSGWGQTPEEIAGRIHEFYVRGANLYNPHAWYYSTLAGWWEWAPPCTSFRQPYWKHYPLFSDYVTRLSYLLSQGTHVCDVAVLFPTSTVHAGGTYPGAYDGAARSARDAFNASCRRLEGLGVDYDVLDEPSLLHGRVEKGRLRVADESYRCVVLPSVSTLPRAGMATLSRLAASGGIVAACGVLPSGSSDAGQGDPAIRKAVKSLFGQPQPKDGPGVQVRRGALYAPASIEDLGDAIATRLPPHARGPVQALHRRVAGRDVYYLVGGSARTTDVTLLGAGPATLLLPWTGRSRPAPSRPDGPGRVTVSVDFRESRSLFVVLGNAPISLSPKRSGRLTAASPAAETKGAPPDGQKLPEAVSLPDEWASSLVPTLDNRWGDFARPASPGPPAVECRSFLYREERAGEDGLELRWHSNGPPDGGWRRVTATYGPYWWITRSDVGNRALKLPGPDDGDWRPDPSVWQPAVYSQRLGIEKDPVYAQWLGPKGRVPDEYLDFGEAPAGTVRFAVTFVHVPEPCDALIRCGTGDARVAVNSRWLPASGPPVARLLAGYNAVTVQFRHPAAGRLRTYVHIGPVGDDETGPYWIWSQTQSDVSDCFVRRVFRLDAIPQRAVLSITADNGYEAYVNGIRVGRDIGAGTERWATAERYQVARLLRRGDNVIAVRAVNMGGPAGLVAVLWWDGGTDGRSGRRIVTDGQWRACSRLTPGTGLRWTNARYDDGGWQPARIVGAYPCEPWGAVANLRRTEPSILPASGWLNGAVLPWIPDLVLDPRPGLARPVGWFRFRTPPGATSFRLAVTGTCRAFIAGRECEIGLDGVVAVPLDLQGPSLDAALRVEQAAGHYEGAAFTAPIAFTVGGGGVIRLGDWAAQGLPHYSGGITYSQSFSLTQAHADAPLVLDLGRVRGTAQVTVNGRSAGVRIWRPYRFDVTGLLRAGDNRIEVTVYNTLGPYFGAGYPTPYVYGGQEASGLFGPVRLTSSESAARQRADLSGLANVALNGLGATVTASSEHPSGRYLSDSVVAGHTSGERWAQGGGWNDGTEGEFPDWLEVQLPEPALVGAVRVITLEPAARYGIRDFDVLCRRGGEWVTCAEVRENEDEVMTVPIAPVRTSRVRIVVHSSNDDMYSRIIAVQVFARPSGGMQKE